ncbi:DNA invertase Pin-like site-specific DNA recombinase/regulator of replication initiation timing [Paenibacillus jamilae]|nr:DNA invertase Pin-like site-specific DNA recombinase/regulator of replication initiation timing [Paenibacillus jamilae]
MLRTLTGSEKFTKTELEALVAKIKALIYARVSTDGQVDNYSIESQIERCMDLAKQKGIKEEEVVVLIEDGESGDNPNRPMINYVLFLLEYGIGDHVIFLHPNRMSRFLHLQTQLSNRIWGLGKDFWFVEFDFDKSSPESMLNFNIQGSIAEYNKAKILADTKRGRITKVKNGQIPGLNRIYGYTYDTELDTLVENPVEKEIYLKMVDMLLHKDYSCSRIAEELSLRNVPAPKKDRWYQVTISRIFKNETYTGNYYFGKTKVIRNADGTKKQVPQPREEWRRISVPVYIDMETYHRIQKRLDELNKNKPGRPTEDYLLQGICRCGRCGAAVSSGVTTKTKNRLLKYYVCQHKTKKSYKVGTGESNPICKGRNWRVDYVDKIIWEYVKNIISEPAEFFERIIKQQSENSNSDELLKQKKKLDKSLQEKEASRERYTEMYAAGIIKSMKDLEDKVSAVDEQIKDIKEELHTIDQSLSTVLNKKNHIELVQKSLRSFKYLLDNDHIDIETKRKVTRLFVKKVMLNEDNKINVYLHLGFIDNAEKESDNKHINVNSRQGHGRPKKSIYFDPRRVFGRNGLFFTDKSWSSFSFSDSTGFS